MQILSVEEIIQIETQEIAAGFAPDKMMEKVGQQMAEKIDFFFPRYRAAIIFLGKGNNAGDGLVVARELFQRGWRIKLNFYYSIDEWSLLMKQQWEKCQAQKPLMAYRFFDQPDLELDSPSLIIDAVLGLGSKGSLRGVAAEAVTKMNHLRLTKGARTVAVDFPSGMTPEFQSGLAVVADLTLTVGFPKDFLVREENSSWVGRIEVIPLFHSTPVSQDELLVGEELQGILPRRASQSHKKHFGRVVVFGGSKGYCGAPLLSAQAALKAGAGLVDLAVPETIYAAVATKAPAEIMVHEISSVSDLERLRAQGTVWVVGPGGGPKIVDYLEWLIREIKVPLILDADALRGLPRYWELVQKRLHPLILTPHPGEMKHLLGRDFFIQERPSIVRNFVQRWSVHLILKGSRTLVHSPQGKLFYNSTGNPALACGGSGDTLAGIVAAIVAQGVRVEEAIRLAVWWHGRAADVVVRQTDIEEGVTPSQVAAALPMALLSARQGTFSSSLF